MQTKAFRLHNRRDNINKKQTCNLFATRPACQGLPSAMHYFAVIDLQRFAARALFLASDKACLISVGSAFIMHDLCRAVRFAERLTSLWLSDLSQKCSLFRKGERRRGIKNMRFGNK